MRARELEVLLEDRRAELAGNAGAPVDDFEAEVVTVRCRLRAQDDGAPRRRVADRVREQVRERELDALRVGADAAQAGQHLGAELDLRALGRAALRVERAAGQ